MAGSRKKATTRRLTRLERPSVAERAWVVAAWPAQNACEPTQLQVPLESSMFEVSRSTRSVDLMSNCR
jgi:hypothetical protein